MSSGSKKTQCLLPEDRRETIKPHRWVAVLLASGDGLSLVVNHLITTSTSTAVSGLVR